MIAAQRHKAILDLVRAEGGASIRFLSEALDTPAVTIRRDLDRLDALHQLTRTHGGAVDRQALQESSYAEKLGQAVREKRAIAQLAATIVSDGDVVIIGPGTTTEALAHELVSRSGLTVVTNSLLVAQIFTDSPQNQVIMTGGTLRPSTRALVGEATNVMLRTVRADVTFLSGNGLVADFGLSTPDLIVAETDRAAAAAGRQVVALVDHTKVGVRAAIQTVPSESIAHLVTDSKSSVAELEQLADRGIRVHVSGTSSGLLNRI
ncbi:DeoR/GlpR family DNA-binding transcription regulator [soil metagenome]